MESLGALTATFMDTWQKIVESWRKKEKLESVINMTKCYKLTSETSASWLPVRTLTVPRCTSVSVLVHT